MRLATHPGRTAGLQYGVDFYVDGGDGEAEDVLGGMQDGLAYCIGALWQRFVEHGRDRDGDGVDGVTALGGGQSAAGGEGAGDGVGGPAQRFGGGALGDAQLVRGAFRMSMVPSRTSARTALMTRLAR
jgi:hypothetical protein